jgi:hypothetical protein
VACVAGTPQAREALKNAEIPQTEAVRPGPAPDLQATYDGEPQFTDIPDSPVRYAVNSPSPIFNCDRRYYWCEDGIWYDSDWAVGPWSVCSFVPRPIYCIPPSCPFYYATYCRIFCSSLSSICFGYYPGYRGCYAWGPTVVYGTGWRYRWWVGTSCYIRPCTWGIGVRYSPSACSWTFGLGWGNSCAWSGVGHYRRSPSIAVGVGGGVNLRTGLGYRNNVGVDVVVPVRHNNRPDNLRAAADPDSPAGPAGGGLRRSPQVRVAKDPSARSSRPGSAARGEGPGWDSRDNPKPHDAAQDRIGTLRITPAHPRKDDGIPG